jgi:hypothetical protein
VRLRAVRPSRLISNAEIENPNLVRDVKNFGVSLRIPTADWLDFVLEKFAGLDGSIVDERGQCVDLDIEIFLPSDEDIDAGRGALIEARIRNWFEDTFSAPVPEHVVPHVRVEARERFRFVATILRAAFPREAMLWGVRAANDNSRLIPESV